jgi:hypothetical protein
MAAVFCVAGDFHPVQLVQYRQPVLQDLSIVYDRIGVPARALVQICD